MRAASYLKKKNDILGPGWPTQMEKAIKMFFLQFSLC